MSGPEAPNEDERWLALALEQARLGRAEGGIPIGAVLVADGRVLGAEGLLRQQGVELVNLDSAECRQLMREFIAAEPALWHEDIGEVQRG